MIEIEHLTKRYGDITAVSDLSIRIESGQIYGFLGPNGAGKSTTMNMMTGCLSATEGHVRIGGYDIFEQPSQAKRLIGYLPEQPPLYMNETPEEYLRFVGEAKGLHGLELKNQIEEVMEQTGIEQMRGRRISALSKGYRQRVGIAQALLGNPQVIVLDEPTVGLDPLQIIEIRDLIRELGRTHTVIFSSHILLQYIWTGKPGSQSGFPSISCLSYNERSNWLTIASLGFYVRRKDCQSSSCCSVRFEQVEPPDAGEFASHNRLNRQREKMDSGCRFLVLEECK